MVATGLFTTREGWALAYGAAGGDRADECCGLFYGCGFNLLFANMALVFVVVAWVGVTSFILFFTIEVSRSWRSKESVCMARRLLFARRGLHGVLYNCSW